MKIGKHLSYPLKFTELMSVLSPAVDPVPLEVSFWCSKPPRQNEHSTADLQYEPEITTEKGFDIKTTLLGGSMRANLSLYDMKAKNFQVLVRNNPNGTIGLGTTQVANAEAARAWGLEFDLTYAITDWLTSAIL